MSTSSVCAPLRVTRPESTAPARPATGEPSGAAHRIFAGCFSPREKQSPLTVPRTGSSGLPRAPSSTSAHRVTRCHRGPGRHCEESVCGRPPNHPPAPFRHTRRRPRPPRPGHRLRAERDPRPRPGRQVHRRPAHGPFARLRDRSRRPAARPRTGPRERGDRRPPGARAAAHPRGDRHRPLPGGRGTHRRGPLDRVPDGSARTDRRRGTAAAPHHGPAPAARRPRRAHTPSGVRARCGTDRAALGVATGHRVDPSPG